MGKFIHVSDTHLGCEVPVRYRDIRKRDFISAFKQVVDFAINKKVDFIIHSGDFLDDYFRISSSILGEIIDTLIKLKENNIPLIVIKGNHDNKGHRQNFFDILKRLNLIIEPSFKKPIEIGEYKIYGISEPENYSGETLNKIYKTILPKLDYGGEDGYKIFLFHGVPDIFYSNPQEPRIVPISHLPKGIDYYAFGHFHLPKKYIEGETIYAVPGSTERTEITDAEEMTDKGFYYYNYGRVDFIKIKTRKISIIKKHIKDEQDIDDLVEHIISKNKDTIVKTIIVYRKHLYEYLRSKLDKLIKSGYMIVEDIKAEDTDAVLIEHDESKNLFEDIIEKTVLGNKEDIIKIFNKIREVVDDIYIENNTNIDKAREIVRNNIIKWLE